MTKRKRVNMTPLAFTPLNKGKEPGFRRKGRAGGALVGISLRRAKRRGGGTEKAKKVGSIQRGLGKGVCSLRKRVKRQEDSLERSTRR